MKKFVTKPVVVEAIQWTGKNLEEIKQIIKPFVFANNCEDRQYFIADGDETGNSIYFTGFFNHGFSNLRLPINHYLIINRTEKNIDCYLSTCNEEEFKNKFGEYYGVEVGEDKDTITECAYIPMCVNSMLHCSREKDTASDLIGKSLKDITTPPDADREV